MALEELTLNSLHLSRLQKDTPSLFAPNYRVGTIIRSAPYSTYVARFGNEDFLTQAGIPHSSWAVLAEYDGKKAPLLFSEESARRIKEELRLKLIRDFEGREVDIITIYNRALGIRVPREL